MQIPNRTLLIIIKIKDTGKGIPKKDFKKLFEPFFTTKPVNKGTGLGLFVSYGIMKDLGGRYQDREFSWKRHNCIFISSIRMTKSFIMPERFKSNETSGQAHEASNWNLR